ncbi:MAG: 2-oxoacid:acceptor oxidoreductase family protein [Rhodospirillales bacterium]|jgi:indolepyruvate ferredoxin oxidoreductase beta subunit|nr:pyruvate ferredoxin oxidoreductase [Rhodospirillaceae bacterium]MDP6429155.1 2-oxoacid:acceptor oxidoreductase family protein [Rhodospirillales bacterium]MDP6643347.1 2-oxoacid:acceptor oxidoreductase family protein [Rhodospirillales bacterium]MDP6840041.1 2-oxoacid:acceptor oxidoreductase family protein [Rhodospirillales bacterium]
MNRHSVQDAKSKKGAKAQKAAATKNVLIVGVGGQGVIMISKVLALLCQTQGYQVKQSEVHGMAKRGGGVFSHVRFGEEVWSPTIPMGEADMLIALEWAEGLRWLPYLKPETGIFIADTQRIVPPFACRNRAVGAKTAYAKETPAEILEKVADGYALDAGGFAEELGEPRAANTILLGALSASLEFAAEDWLKIIAKFVPKGTEKINEQAFGKGRGWIEEVRENPAEMLPETPAPAIPAIPAGEVDISLDIIDAWCKSCDICVRLCPERCLELNEYQIVRLKDPDACTGCRLCEWLCPDFAITVNRVRLDDIKKNKRKAA